MIRRAIDRRQREQASTTLLRFAVAVAGLAFWFAVVWVLT